MLTITKYEQSAFVLSWDECQLVVDLGSYSSHETVSGLESIDAALVTHIHPDHFNEPNLQELGCPVYTVGEVADAVTDPQLAVTTVGAGETFLVGDTGFQVTAVPSDHGPKAGLVENVGYVIRANGCSLYFLGDMKVSTPPPPGPFDVVLVPVGDNGGYVFTPREAADYIRLLEHDGLVIPVHYDKAPGNASVFAELLEGTSCQVRILETGEEMEVRP